MRMAKSFDVVQRRTYENWLAPTKSQLLPSSSSRAPGGPPGMVDQSGGRRLVETGAYPPGGGVPGPSQAPGGPARELDAEPVKLECSSSRCGHVSGELGEGPGSNGR